MREKAPDALPYTLPLEIFQSKKTISSRGCLFKCQKHFLKMNRDEKIENFYSSRKWRKCRKIFLEDKNNLCEICLEKGLIVPAEHVHHKIPITSENVNDPTITLNHENLMALCENCHQEQHRKKRWRCAPDGRVIF